MILKNLFFCMLVGEIIFVLGIHQTQKPLGCTAIAILLHYFALASILWLFLHGKLVFILEFLSILATDPRN